MLDWPGRIAVTVFLSGCNAHCTYCHNGELMQPTPPRHTIDDLMQHLRSRRSWVDGVVITGGEPTTDPGLFALIDAVASLCLPVKLDTNGTHPEILANVMDAGLVSSVAMDIKATPERYDAVIGVSGAASKVSASVALLKGSGLDHEFRTTTDPGSVTLPEIIRIAEWLQGGQRYVLQQYRPDRAWQSAARQRAAYHPDTLHEIAGECGAWIPTSVRGA